SDAQRVSRGVEGVAEPTTPPLTTPRVSNDASTALPHYQHHEGEPSMSSQHPPQPHHDVDQHHAEHEGHGHEGQHHAGHEAHGGHAGHGDHVGQFRRLFWIMLLLAIPVVGLY